MLASFSRNLRLAGAEYLNMVNPIRLFNMNQARKLGAELSNVAMPRVFREDISMRASLGREASFMSRAKDYFSGINLEDRIPINIGSTRSLVSSNKSLYQRVASQRAMTRKATAGLLGVGVGTSLFLNQDSSVRNVTVGGMKIGAGLLGGAALAEFSARRGFGGIGAVGAAGLIGLSAYKAIKG